MFSNIFTKKNNQNLPVLLLLFAFLVGLLLVAPLLSYGSSPPIVNAGPDKEVFESESVTLQGSGSDPDGDSITYSWYCNGGSLSSSSLAQPIFYAPFVSGDKEYTCTLTVTDSRGASDSDSMRVLVKDRESATLSVSLSAEPSSGCTPLKDVDLKTNVSGTATGTATFLFDCENNGTWEKIHTENTNSYTAYNLCSYFLADDYEAKVKVERGGLSAIDTVTIKARSCQDDEGLFDVSKRARNQTKGQSSWYESITAVPADKVIFEIKITSTSDEKVYDLVVKDTLPEKIAWYGNLKIDDKDSSKNITEGVNIGDLDPGKSKTLTFEVLIAQSADFSYGSTALINTVLVFNEQAADTDTAKVTVTKTSVAGSVTDVPAGVLSSAKISLLIVIFFVFLASYFFLLKFYISEKTPGLNFGTLLSETKERARDFFLGLYLSPQEKSKVQLSQAIAAIKKQEKIE